jgi:hypothetical protein
MAGRNISRRVGVSPSTIASVSKTSLETKVVPIRSLLHIQRFYRSLCRPKVRSRRRPWAREDCRRQSRGSARPIPR